MNILVVVTVVAGIVMICTEYSMLTMFSGELCMEVYDRITRVCERAF